MWTTVFGRRGAAPVVALVLAALAPAGAAAEPEMVDPRLEVRPVASGLVTPVSMAFLGAGDMLVLEKNTGRVMRVRGEHPPEPVLDLGVNFASERGLLGIALDPDFPADPGVYLFWTESSTGTDTNVVSSTPLLGNRVDRFIWDGTSATLSFDRNLLRIRAVQADPGQPERGNHDGGVLAFGPDRKLYVVVGDVGRRGQLQNLPCGWSGDCAQGDDQFGGPEPDRAHLTGVVLRVEEDGSAPPDNPFHAVGAAHGGEVGAGLQQVFAYGIRNSFGMAFDPRSGDLWLQENADDAFDEINRVEPGFNSGWIQTMGPVSRVAEFKAIETSFGARSLQQIRWSPANIADTPEEALRRMFRLPGSAYSDPELSWKYAVAPAGIGFVRGDRLGRQYRDSLVVGAARPALEDGYLLRLRLTGNRRKIAVDDRRLEDRVADNAGKFDATESESLLFGRGFGVGTDVETGPDGRLYVVSLTHGAVYAVGRR